MKLVRAKHLFVAVTAIFSLFVSAVSACACSHHEPVRSAIEPSSCHGPSHEKTEAAAVETPEESRRFDSDCNCFVNIPVPAIIAKTDNKRVGVEKRFAEPPVVSTAFVPVLAVETSLPTGFDPPDLKLRFALLSALPSRAPPRL